MPPYIILWHESDLDSILEWGTKYHVAGTIDADSVAFDLAVAESELFSDNIHIDRWTYYNATGTELSSGAFLESVVGQQTNEMQPIKYAILLRLDTASNVKRHSTRYIHGYTENLVTNGVFNASGLTALAAYNTAVAAVSSYRDSDNLTVLGHSFRSFTMRHRMRRKTI